MCCLPSLARYWFWQVLCHEGHSLCNFNFLYMPLADQLAVFDKTVAAKAALVATQEGDNLQIKDPSYGSNCKTSSKLPDALIKRARQGAKLLADRARRMADAQTIHNFKNARSKLPIHTGCGRQLAAHRKPSHPSPTHRRSPLHHVPRQRHARNVERRGCKAW